MPSNIYVDGFNLYHGSLKKTTYKWLDIATMCRTLFPGVQINRIRYFTARAKARPHDKQIPIRQDIYFRALRTIPNLTIHEGQFRGRGRLMPQYPFAFPNPWTKVPQNVFVYRMEEKGSDVNLATYLMDDCYSRDFDEAVVISNDSDLALPVDLVTSKYNCRVVVVNPHPSHKLSGDLIKVASSNVRTINRSVLAASQFPSTLTDAKGAFTKPAAW